MDDGRGRLAAEPALVPAPIASAGIGNALLSAFSCQTGMTAEFDRLLAKLR